MACFRIELIVGRIGGSNSKYVQNYQVRKDHFSHEIDECLQNLRILKLFYKVSQLYALYVLKILKVFKSINLFLQFLRNWQKII